MAHLRLWIAVFLPVLALSAWLPPPGAAAPTRAERAERRAAMLARDARLARAVEVLPKTTHLGALLERLRKELDVELQAQSDLGRRPVLIAAGKRPAGELLADLGRLFGGSWARFRGGYLLTTDERIASGVEQFREPDRSSEKRLLWATLTREQKQVLATTRRLAWSQLSAGQRKLVEKLLTDAFLRDPVAFPRALVDGKDVHLRAERVEAGKVEAVGLYGPARQEDGRFKPEQLLAIEAPRS